MATPAVTGGFTVMTGDTATASYLNSLCQSVVTFAGAHTLGGNPSASTAQAWQEITIGTSLAFTGTVLDAIQSLRTTDSPTFAGITGTGTSAINTLTLTNPLATTSGGSGSATVAAANQSLTPATVVYALPGATQTVNWASGSAFYITLSANLTISFSNAVDGQIITILILNTASNFTVAWPTIKWPGGAAPIMTGGAKYDIYTIERNSTVGGYIGLSAQNIS